MRIVVALLAFVLAVTTQCATNNNQQLTSSSDYSTHTSGKTEPIPSPDTDKFLGVVKNGKFQCLWPKDTTEVSPRFTKIRMMEAMAPEAAELDLSQYEGCAIMVQGEDIHRGWLYSAHIIDNASPILTTVVQYIFRKTSQTTGEAKVITVPDTDKFLGVVKNGEFQCLWPKRTTAVPFKLTTISMTAAMAPDAAKLDLSQYEGCAVMVQGHADIEWIYDAHIIDNTGPIFTTVVRYIFSETSQTPEETEMIFESLEPYAEGFFGVVKNGKFHSFSPIGVFDDSLTLTNVGMVEARPPEAGILSLSRYEGCAIMVQGRGGDKWIYSARIVDNAGPILTAIVQYIFNKK